MGEFFDKVRIVGQGFVDEIFHVYQDKHPQKEIKYINANDDVLFMINRSLWYLNSIEILTMKDALSLKDTRNCGQRL